MILMSFLVFATKRAQTREVAPNSPDVCERSTRPGKRAG